MALECPLWFSHKAENQQDEHEGECEVAKEEEEEEDEDEVGDEGEDKVLRERLMVWFANAPLKNSAETETVQPWWTHCLSLSRKIESTKLLARDTHGRNSLGTRKPDTTIYPRGKPRNEFNIVAVGENKPRRGRSSDAFTEQEKGQLVNFLKKLINSQTATRERDGMASATGYLSDAHIIQFFCLEAKISTDGNRLEYILYASKVLLLASDSNSLKENGALAFLALFDSTPEDLGWRVPDVYVENQWVPLCNQLGAGSSAVVFAGHF